MRVGDFIYATYKGHRIIGKIVYGYSPKMHEFTDQEGKAVDRREIIGVLLEQEIDAPIVRMKGGQWSFQPLENTIEVPSMPQKEQPAIYKSPPEGKKKRKQLMQACQKWIKPLRTKLLV